MSTIPPRAKLNSIHWAGRYTWLIAFAVVGVVGVLIKTGVYTATPIYLSVMFSFGISTFIWLGIFIDRKARIKRMLSDFETMGFVSQELDLIEDEIIDALESMEPHSFSIETIRFATRGLIDEQEVILLELFTEVDDHTTTFTGCAAWIPTELPTTTIRRRTLKDKFSKHEPLGDPKFDKQRIFSSDDPDSIAETLLTHSDWFISKKSQISSFRMGQPPGKVEQWAFVGNWIVLIDQGSAYTKQHLAMAEFLTQFTTELEENCNNTLIQ